MLLLADNSLLASLLFIAGCAWLIFWLLRRSQRYFKRNPRSRDSGPIATQPRPANEWTGAYKDPSALIDRQMVELHNTGRDLKAQLDNKIVILQELCAKSEQQIERMEKLLEEFDSRR